MNNPEQIALIQDDPPEDEPDKFGGMLDDAPTEPSNIYGEE